MKAVVVYDYDGKFHVDDVDLDEPKRGEVKVKIVATGLCHTDISVADGTIPLPTPMVIGHEASGMVEDVGEDVESVKKGDKVLLTWYSCGKCNYCSVGKFNLCDVFMSIGRQGMLPRGGRRFRKGDKYLNHMVCFSTFSEYTVVDERSVVKISDDVDLDTVCIVPCAVLTGIGAVLNTVNVRIGSSMAVFGLGGVGMNIIQGGVLANASKIIAVDLYDWKLEKAKELGATHTINARKENPVERIKEITNGLGVDYSFEAIGNEKIILQAFKSLGKGGKAVIVGGIRREKKITLHPIEIQRFGRSIIGCYLGDCKPRADVLNYVKLYKLGKIKLDELITGKFKLEDVNEAVKEVLDGKHIRVVLKP